jgi:single-strand DNA-binding protein
MLNNVVLIGRLTKDVELRVATSGTAVTTVTLAINGMNERVDYPNVVLLGKQAENAAKYLSKGRLVAVEGRLQTRSYESNGVKHYVTEVVAENVKYLERNPNSSGTPAVTDEELAGLL